MRPKRSPFQLSFNSGLRVVFQGAQVTSDGGLFLVRESDQGLGANALLAGHLADSRRGKNVRLPLFDLLRQSIYIRLAGCILIDPDALWCYETCGIMHAVAESRRLAHGRAEAQMNQARGILVALVVVSVLAVGMTGSAGAQLADSQTVRVKKPHPLHTIYVANLGADSITVYKTGNKGDVKPRRTIVSGKSSIAYPMSVAVDPHGNIYECENTNPGAILEFSHRHIKGDPAIATVTGATTGMVFPVGMAIDTSGKLYVVNSDPYVNSVEIFAPPTPGTSDPAPLATIAGGNTQLSVPVGIALDSAGDVYVVNQFATSVTEFTPPFSGSMNVAPTAVISGANAGFSNPAGIALDQAGNIYVTNQNSSAVLEFAPPVAGGSNQSPIATISGSETDLSNPVGVAVDTFGNLFVSNSASDTIVEFAPPVSGANNLAPIREIDGSRTGLNSPQFLTLGR